MIFLASTSYKIRKKISSLFEKFPITTEYTVMENQSKF